MYRRKGGSPAGDECGQVEAGKKETHPAGGCVGSWGKRRLLFVFLLGPCGRGAALCLCLTLRRLRFFHGLLGFREALGARFGALLAQAKKAMEEAEAAQGQAQAQGGTEPAGPK